MSKKVPTPPIEDPGFTPDVPDPQPSGWLIEKGVTPPPRKKSTRESKYPWAVLDVSDAFSLEADDPVKFAKQFTTTCYVAGKRLGRKFKCWAELDASGNPTGVVKVSRTA